MFILPCWKQKGFCCKCLPSANAKRFFVLQPPALYLFPIGLWRSFPHSATSDLLTAGLEDVFSLSFVLFLHDVQHHPLLPNSFIISVLFLALHDFSFVRICGCLFIYLPLNSPLPLQRTNHRTPPILRLRTKHSLPLQLHCRDPGSDHFHFSLRTSQESPGSLLCLLPFNPHTITK